MATIDLTLNGIKIPALDGYTPPFGVKKVSGGLTTQEVNDNVIAPFVKQRPVEITENSSTGSVEYNASLVINSADAVLTLGSGTYVGCVVKVIAATAGSVSYNSGTTDTLAAGQIVNYIWGGSSWVSDITITGKTIAYADNTMTGVQPTITGGASTITSSNLTANKVLVSNANGKVAASSCPSNRIGVGSKHYTTTLKTGFSGGIQWCVTNGICVMSMIGVTPSSIGGSQTVLNNIPKPKIYAYTSDGSNSFWIVENTSTLYCNANGAYGTYLTLVYPVADDWSES